VPATEIPTAANEPDDAKIVGAIPARYGSSRLPGKPLLSLVGRPLIEHVYRRAAQAAELDRVVVLTDDSRIFDAVTEFGGDVEMTPVDCASGTDRIAGAAAGWQAAAIVNIQGDEPLIEPQAIDRLARHLRDHPADPMVTLAAPATAADRDDPNVVKVVTDRSGSALYFSRAAIPYRRGSAPIADRRHLGIYGYQVRALQELAALPPSSLEQSESLEQLRALENGIRIRVLDVAQAWQGVDTMEDLEKVQSILESATSTPG
jgi:3-deoxy-manno-octulosonate cytidylyltransferase (CMP-KDO synthetase)